MLKTQQRTAKAVKDNSFYVLRERRDGEFTYCRVVDPDRIGNHGCPHLPCGRYMKPRAFNVINKPALSQELAAQLASVKVVSHKKHVKLEVEEDSERFKNNVDIAKECCPFANDSIESMSEEEFSKCTKILNQDGCCGCAVKPNGEIVSCYRHTSIKHYSGVMYDLLIAARAHGGKTLNCYSEEIATVAEKCGFECVAKVPYQEDGANEKLAELKPTMYILKLKDESLEDTITHLRKKDYKVSSDEDFDNVPTMPKGMAKKYRDGLSFFA